MPKQTIPSPEAIAGLMPTYVGLSKASKRPSSMPHKRQRTEEEPDNEGILENPEKPSPPKKRARTSAGSETARKQDVEKDAVIKEAPAAAKVVGKPRPTATPAVRKKPAARTSKLSVKNPVKYHEAQTCHPAIKVTTRQPAVQDHDTPSLLSGPPATEDKGKQEKQEKQSNPSFSHSGASLPTPATTVSPSPFPSPDPTNTNSEKPTTHSQSAYLNHLRTRIACRAEAYTLVSSTHLPAASVALDYAEAYFSTTALDHAETVTKSNSSSQKTRLAESYHHLHAASTSLRCRLTLCTGMMREVRQDHEFVPIWFEDNNEEKRVGAEEKGRWYRL
ncbi:hypothetical protein LTS18_008785 [Coniosporium uncinatum]|uniref:Uncharacterized protein n=1 Tax=Coniosporium uncinatum TaxID=93489 RepID=A0ACC3DMQ2_9PEZI|nr:hypothetical protein LTS18_008785 [Coniosporium uncinatum]